MVQGRVYSNHIIYFEKHSLLRGVLQSGRLLFLLLGLLLALFVGADLIILLVNILLLLL